MRSIRIAISFHSFLRFDLFYLFCMTPASVSLERYINFVGVAGSQKRLGCMEIIFIFPPHGQRGVVNQMLVISHKYG